MSGHGTALTVILGFIAIMLLIGVVLLAVMIYVIFRYRVPLRGVAAMAAALVYVVSPIDVLPEAVLGPIGLIDDVGVVGATAIFVYRLIQARNPGPPGGPGPPSNPGPEVRPGNGPPIDRRR